jgi:hypothetical protein
MMISQPIQWILHKRLNIWSTLNNDYTMPFGSGYLGQPEAWSKWLDTNMARHEAYRIVSARGSLQSVPGLLAKPIGLGTAQPDLAGLTRPDGRPG